MKTKNNSLRLFLISLCFVVILLVMVKAPASDSIEFNGGVFAPPPSSGTELVPGEDYVEGEILVGVEPGFDIEQVKNEIIARGGTIKKEMLAEDYVVLSYDILVVEVPEGLEFEFIGILENVVGVTYAEVNQINTATLTPNDPYFRAGETDRDQWNLHKYYLGMEKAWDIETGKDNVIIAVLDTGINTECDQFKGRYTKGIDVVNGDNNPIDDHEHGSIMSSIIIAKPNDGKYMAGMVWGSKLMPIKILDEDKHGTKDQEIDGIEYAVKQIVENEEKDCVISMSFCSPKPDSSEREAIQNAYVKGCLLVAASGNDGEKVKKYPCAYDEVICVGAIDSTSTRTAVSNYGEHLELVAPTERKLSNGDRHGLTAMACYGGVQCKKERDEIKCPTAILSTPGETSPAAPQVAAVASLLFSKYRNDPRSSAEKRDMIRQTLKDTAKDCNRQGWDEETGWGMVRADKALEYNPPGWIGCGDNVCSRPWEGCSNCPQDCCKDSDSYFPDPTSGSPSIYKKGYCEMDGKKTWDECASDTELIENHCSHDTLVFPPHEGGSEDHGPRDNVGEKCEQTTITCPIVNPKSCEDGACIETNSEGTRGGAETTIQLCTNKIDDDYDGLIDLMDPDCTDNYNIPSPIGGNENNIEKCTDGEDNDNDLLIDALDPDCAGALGQEARDITVDFLESSCTPKSILTNSITGDKSILYYCPPVYAEPDDDNLACDGYDVIKDILTNEIKNTLQCSIGIDSPNPQCSECDAECGRDREEGAEEDPAEWTMKEPENDLERAAVLAICGGNLGTRSESDGFTTNIFGTTVTIIDDTQSTTI